MIKIGLVVPCENFIENAFDIFNEHNIHSPSVNGEFFEMEEIIINENNMPSHIDADIILTRGLLAEILKKIQKEIPTVEIPIPTADILRTIRKSTEMYGQKRIGIIAANNMLAGVNGLADLIDTPIRTYVLGTHWNGPALVDQALSEGCEIILGGLNTCNYAEMIHINNMVIKTSKEAFWQGLTSAKQSIYYARKEQEKSSRLQTIVDTSSDGIIVLDMGKRVQILNSRAQTLLQTDESSLDKTVTELPFTLEFKDMMSNNKEYEHELFPMNKTMFHISKQFFKIKNVVSGTVLTLQTVQELQTLEGNIRNRIYSKGHVAKMTFNDIIASSPIMEETIRKTKKYSMTNSNILLIGESGTGKEVFAQSIHNASQRSKAQFVAVNCAAIPDQLLESELFGYAPGAFTGASKEGKAGLFEIAHEGTMFLDEIGEIPMSLQAKLLRVLQERQIMRIGSDKIIPVNVRILAATNKNLEDMVENNLFRRDLFYRLDVLRVNIPSLDERIEDIPLLARYYYKHNFPKVNISDDAANKLCEYNWRGNVRQLFNILERLAVLCESGSIEEYDILDNLSELPLSATKEVKSTEIKNKNSFSEEDVNEILNALKKNRYHKGNTAKYLGISRATLWRKIKENNLQEKLH